MSRELRTLGTLRVHVTNGAAFKGLGLRLDVERLRAKSLELRA
jgi:hypothetical protein